jgi:hypothetical protein
MQEQDIWDIGVNQNKRISAKTKLNKDKYCKKNKLGNFKYGPHTYVQNNNYCVKCNHLRKEKKNYEFE